MDPRLTGVDPDEIDDDETGFGLDQSRFDQAARKIQLAEFEFEDPESEIGLVQIRIGPAQIEFRFAEFEFEITKSDRSEFNLEFSYPESGFGISNSISG